jgi:hypothetical protein
MYSPRNRKAKSSGVGDPDDMGMEHWNNVIFAAKGIKGL